MIKTKTQLIIRTNWINVIKKLGLVCLKRTMSKSPLSKTFAENPYAIFSTGARYGNESGHHPL